MTRRWVAVAAAVAWATAGVADPASAGCDYTPGSASELTEYEECRRSEATFAEQERARQQVDDSSTTSTTGLVSDPAGADVAGVVVDRAQPESRSTGGLRRDGADDDAVPLYLAALALLAAVGAAVATMRRLRAGPR
jgi:hypothetical protein